MKTKNLVGIVIAFLVGVLVAATGEDVAAQVKSLVGKNVTGEYLVIVNGEELSDKGAIIDSKANVPVRSLSDAIGAEVKVEGKTIYITTEELTDGGKVVVLDGKYYTKYDLLNKKKTLEESLVSLDNAKKADLKEYEELKNSGRLEGDIVWQSRFKSRDDVIAAKTTELAKVNEALKAFE